jgi:hypothetical protein
MVIAEEFDLLEREILFLYKTLANYGYFMGDMWPLFIPWRTFENSYEHVVAEAEPWLIEGSLLIALTVLWGARDGAHSIDKEESSRISLMIEKIRSHSERTEEISRVIDLIKEETDEGMVASRSQAIYQKYVVGYLKSLACMAEERAGVIPS